ATPFGFTFADATLIVSEAFGGAAGASAVSSYDVADDQLESITRSAPTTQSAACWVAVTPDGRFAYTTNTGSGTVTGFQVARDGVLERIDDGVTGVPGGAPIDAATSSDGDSLYVLDAARATIVSFGVHDDGSLARRDELTGLPPASVGLAVR